MDYNLLASDILKSDPDITLVIVNRGEVHKFSQRGVADLLNVYDSDRALLCQADLADKIVGKAAAAFMVMGKINSLYTPKITSGALDMLESAGIPCIYDTIVPYVINRNCTGRCPLDSLCADLSDPAQMVESIRKFLQTK